ncbi:hypothetical protein BO70DRAFT_161643 [Aspergillus heteromorphus CBS 117.55]|uniref:Uncharacterized protein n=1 Tax=Aspergillus heteromorphus CBS 117.55 TaxID=1448321 RepID=A0A317WRP6_9EURO|nr:uncharacterized protein BO70DRAFT_161643 [Aspergillus heteromorphus CBS 117.55]PWY89124.1 hypothetical protein BO70DRAFT_161643 [Aspergillus heteromorphus CBS 117.55]
MRMVCREDYVSVDVHALLLRSITIIIIIIVIVIIVVVVVVVAPRRRELTVSQSAY